jgi:hypothetical protein
MRSHQKSVPRQSVRFACTEEVITTKMTTATPHQNAISNEDERFDANQAESGYVLTLAQ